MIDKYSAQWKQMPWWFRANMVGVKTRRTTLGIEIALLIASLAFWLIGQNPTAGYFVLLCSYATGWLVRYGDKHQVW